MMKALFLLLFIPQLVFGFTGTNILDNFNRGNENPITGSWDFPLYDAIDAQCQVVSNTITRAGTTNGQCYWTEDFSLPREVFTTLSNGSSWVNESSDFMYACILNEETTSLDGYRLRVKKETAPDPDAWVVERIDDGSFTNIGSGVGQEISDGDKAGFEMLADGSLDGYYDSGGGYSLLLARNDTDYACTTGKIGLDIANTGNHHDDFGGGDNISDGAFQILRFR